MKKLLTIFVLLLFTSTTYAEIATQKKLYEMPEGTFKKSGNKIIQYNIKGKKIGIYKYSNGKYVKIK